VTVLDSTCAIRVAIRAKPQSTSVNQKHSQEVPKNDINDDLGKQHHETMAAVVVLLERKHVSPSSAAVLRRNILLECRGGSHVSGI